MKSEECCGRRPRRDRAAQAWVRGSEGWRAWSCRNLGGGVGREFPAVGLARADAAVLRALAATGLLGDEILGERRRRGRGRRGCAGGGRAMEGGAGFHGDEGARAAVRRARAENTGE